MCEGRHTFMAECRDAIYAQLGRVSASNKEMRVILGQHGGHMPMKPRRRRKLDTGKATDVV